MRQILPGNDDPTSEEQAPEFDGTDTLQLDDTYRARLATASESATGAAGFPNGSTNCKETTDRLRVLEPALRESATSDRKPLAESGDDPDATGVFVAPEISQ